MFLVLFYSYVNSIHELSLPQGDPGAVQVWGIAPYIIKQIFNKQINSKKNEHNQINTSSNCRNH